MFLINIHLITNNWYISYGVRMRKFFDSTGCSALIIATQYNEINACIVLIHHQCDMTIRDENGDSCVHWSAYKGHVQLMHLLLFHVPNEGIKCCVQKYTYFFI